MSQVMGRFPIIVDLVAILNWCIERCEYIRPKENIEDDDGFN
jgi:hypothetical protein